MNRDRSNLPAEREAPSHVEQRRAKALSVIRRPLGVCDLRCLYCLPNHSVPIYIYGPQGGGVRPWLLQTSIKTMLSALASINSDWFTQNSRSPRATYVFAFFACQTIVFTDPSVCPPAVTRKRRPLCRSRCSHSASAIAKLDKMPVFTTPISVAAWGGETQHVPSVHVATVHGVAA